MGHLHERLHISEDVAVATSIAYSTTATGTVQELHKLQKPSREWHNNDYPFCTGVDPTRFPSFHGNRSTSMPSDSKYPEESKSKNFPEGLLLEARTFGARDIRKRSSFCLDPRLGEAHTGNYKNIQIYAN